MGEGGKITLLIDNIKDEWANEEKEIYYKICSPLCDAGSDNDIIDLVWYKEN